MGRAAEQRARGALLLALLPAEGGAPVSLTYRNEAGRVLTDCPICGQAVVCERHGRSYRFRCYGGHDDAQIVALLNPEVLLELARAENGAAPELVLPAGPLSLPIDEFLARKGEPQIALLGSDDDCLLPALGLGLMLGRGGKGKTTALNDLALHLAAGIDWCGIPVPRPVRTLVIENEGPQEPYRRKLERRRAEWPHDLGDRLHLNVASWASFRLDASGGAQRLREECERLAIELVLADPLDSFGMEGEGTPSEVRRMVDLMRQAGFGTLSGWVAAHHPGKTQHADLVDQASGAWGPKPDLLLLLERLDGNRARLSFPKTRWATSERLPVILAFDPDTSAFEFVAEEGGEERDLVGELRDYLDAHPLRTTTDLAKPRPDGIGANKDAIRDALEANPELFDSITGEAAQTAGRSPRAVLWLLARGSEPVEPVGDLPGGSAASSEVGRDPVGVSTPSQLTLTEPVATGSPPEPVAEADRIAAKYKRPNPKGDA